MIMMHVHRQNTRQLLNLNMILQLISVAIPFCTVLVFGSSPLSILKDCPPGTKGAPERNLLTVKELSIKGCDETSCVFYRTDYFEGYVLATINFTATSVVSTVSALTPLGPIELGKGNICNIVTTGCENMKAGSDVILKPKRRLDALIPPFRGGLTFIFTIDKDIPVFCTIIDIIVKEKTLDLVDIFGGLGK